MNLLSDEDCTRIYNEANGITTKNPPLSTERIFKAMRQAHAKGFAAGAAAQLAEKPSAFLDVVMDCAYTLQELGGNPVSEFTPLYTRRESK